MSYSNTADWTLCHGTTSGPGRNRNVLLSASWPKEASIFRICLKGTLLSLPLLSAAMLTFQSLSLAWSSFSHTTCLLDIDFPSAEILSRWVGAELSCLFYPGDREEPLRQSEFPELLLCCLLLTGVQGGQSHLLDWIQFFSTTVTACDADAVFQAPYASSFSLSYSCLVSASCPSPE